MLIFYRTGHHRESAKEALLITDINILLISKSLIMVDHSMVVRVVSVGVPHPHNLPAINLPDINPDNHLNPGTKRVYLKVGYVNV